jgi:hypothetical protein
MSRAAYPAEKPTPGFTNSAVAMDCFVIESSNLIGMTSVRSDLDYYIQCIAPVLISRNMEKRKNDLIMALSNHTH